MADMIRRLLAAALLAALTPAASAQMSGRDALLAGLRGSLNRHSGAFAHAPLALPAMADDFLLRRAARGNSDAREIAIRSLLALSRGRIHDHVGGGFHRASAEISWSVPSFPKRLSDQALMAIAFTEAWQLTGEEELARTGRRTLDYALRDLAEKSGAFTEGQGAESLVAGNSGPRIAEGRYYAWSEGQVRRMLGGRADVVEAAFGIRREGNVAAELDRAGELRGLNLLSRAVADEALMSRFKMDATELRATLDGAVARMLLVRSHRPPPVRNGRISTASNALIISALARAGAAFDEPRYVFAAGQAARFLRTVLFDERRKVLRAAAVGNDAGASLDYALTIQAMLDVYEVTFNDRWLRFAIELQQRQDELFWDGGAGSYRGAAAVDAELPSANSVAATNLRRLAALTVTDAWLVRSDAIFRSLRDAADAAPEQHAALLAAAVTAEKPVKTVVIAGDPASAETKALLRVVYRSFDPPHVLVFRVSARMAQELSPYVPAVARVEPADKPVAAVCLGASCGTPTSDPEKLAALLGR